MFSQKEFEKALMRIENIVNKFGLTEQAYNHILLRAKRMTKQDKMHAYLAALEDQNFHTWRSDVHTHLLQENKM